MEKVEVSFHHYAPNKKRMWKVSIFRPELFNTPTLLGRDGKPVPPSPTAGEVTDYVPFDHSVSDVEAYQVLMNSRHLSVVTREEAAVVARRVSQLLPSIPQHR